MGDHDGNFLPSLSDTVRQHQLSANKKLGQNFLLNLQLTRKIAHQAGDLTGESVIEVGPGPGGLTRAILDLGARHVTVIEHDERCFNLLQELAAAYPGKLRIIMGDALTLDFNQIARECPTPPKIISNLPYNIGTQLLINWLLVEPWPPHYKDLTLMFQKEVAERIVAKANSDAYGRLSLLAEWRTESKICMIVPPEAFSPPPKVTSAVVHLTLKTHPMELNLARFDQLLKLAFSQRRKMLRQSLKQFNGQELLTQLGIDPCRRAETLTLTEFATISSALEQQQSQS